MAGSSKPFAGMSPAKIRKVLREGILNGKRLSSDQRGALGARLKEKTKKRRKKAKDRRKRK